jgi:hypothetical protein
MHSKDLLVNDCCNRQAVEAICKCLPKPDVVPSLTFIVKAVDTVDGGRFVVAAQNEEIFWIFDLVGEKKAYSLQRLLASVNIVS